MHANTVECNKKRFQCLKNYVLLLQMETLTLSSLRPSSLLGCHGHKTHCQYWQQKSEWGSKNVFTLNAGILRGKQTQWLNSHLHSLYPISFQNCTPESSSTLHHCQTSLISFPLIFFLFLSNFKQSMFLESVAAGVFLEYLSSSDNACPLMKSLFF